jgi:hypothetical protein
MIVIASSDRSAGMSISVWIQQEKSTEALQMTPTRLVAVRSLAQLVLVMATLAFLYQNLWEVRR